MNLLDTGLLFSLANISYLIGTIFLVRRVIKNRDALDDFDFRGSSINVIGMTINVVALVELQSYAAAVISLPTMAFWAITAIYSFKNRNKKIRRII